jgi:DNA-directed RNA polymerase specialized sigma24 family protein
LNALSAKEQTILLMREEGFSHQEIAEAVETTTRSVGSMIARALQKLSVELTQQRETRK